MIKFIGEHGLGEKKQSWSTFELANGIAVTNTYFRKREVYSSTYKSGVNKSQIDYYYVGRENLQQSKDCKVIPGDSVKIQNRFFSDY